MSGSGCELCASHGLGMIAFAARDALFPDGALVRPAATWLLCSRCGSDVLEEHTDRIVERMVLAMLARWGHPNRVDDHDSRRPVAPIGLGQLEDASRAILYAFMAARTGPADVRDDRPAVPEDAPPALREGLARHHLSQQTGACPCGARVSLPPRRERRRAERSGEPLIALLRHRAGCPADPHQLDIELALWSAAIA